MRKWYSTAHLKGSVSPPFTWPEYRDGFKSTVQMTNFLYSLREGNKMDPTKNIELRFCEKLLMFMDLYIGWLPYRVPLRSWKSMVEHLWLIPDTSASGIGKIFQDEAWFRKRNTEAPIEDSDRGSSPSSPFPFLLSDSESSPEFYDRYKDLLNLAKSSPSVEDEEEVEEDSDLEVVLTYSSIKAPEVTVRSPKFSTSLCSTSSSSSSSSSSSFNSTVELRDVMV